MDFDLSEEQTMLKDSLDRLLKDSYGFEQRRKHMAEPTGFSAEMWDAYAEMGLMALPFAEEDGGLGGTPVETMIETPEPPLPAPAGAPAKSTQAGGRTEGQQNQQELARRRSHIDSLQKTIAEAKQAMQDLQQEMDGTSEQVYDDTLDDAARAAVKLQAANSNAAAAAAAAAAYMANGNGSSL